MAHTAQVEHHKEEASGCTWSYTAYTVLSQIDDVQCHTQAHSQLKNRVQLTAQSSCSSCVSAAEHHTTELQNKQDKTAKASHNMKSINEYAPGLPQDK